MNEERTKKELVEELAIRIVWLEEKLDDSSAMVRASEVGRIADFMGVWGDVAILIKELKK